MPRFAPSDEEIRRLYCDTFDLRCDPTSLGPVPVKFARAVLARCGHQPARPAEGEVAELVAWLRQEFVRKQQIGNRDHARKSLRAAELLQRLSPPRPVPVSERLPEPNTKVLAHYFNDLGNGRTICAIWVPAKSWSDDINDDYDNSDHLEYDETDDCYYWPEGWYETIENLDELGYVKVNEGDVIYWQPLPKWPANPTTIRDNK